MCAYLTGIHVFMNHNREFLKAIPSKNPVHVGVCKQHCHTLPCSTSPEKPPSVLPLYFPLVHTAFSFSAMSLAQRKITLRAPQGCGALCNWSWKFLKHHKPMCCAPGYLLCVSENVSRTVEKAECSWKYCRNKVPWGRVWGPAHKNWEWDKFSLNH